MEKEEEVLLQQRRDQESRIARDPGSENVNGPESSREDDAFPTERSLQEEDSESEEVYEAFTA
jgi:hypothetical protein